MRYIVRFCANGVSVCQRRLREEQVLLDHLLQMPDLQCAWLLLLMCANTRANHALRNIPPEDVRPYAEGRDRAARTMLQACLGEKTAEGEPLASTAWAVAATPATLGGLGLHPAMRLLQHGVPRPTRWAIGCYRTCTTAFGVGMRACTRFAVVWSVSRTEGRSAFAATRWQECPTCAGVRPGEVC